MFGKRGINGIIVSVLLVLLALAAVGILWAVLHSSVERSGESISSQSENLIEEVFSLGLNNSNATNNSQQILCSQANDCGNNGLSGENFCLNGDVFRNFVTWNCNNPGGTSSSCFSTSVPQLITDCQFLCSDGVCTDAEFNFLRTFFASPNGNGNGSLQSPFNISAFWNVAQPGDGLILLDGVYTGTGNMINPPLGRDGAPGNPITIRALNDGKVWINGEGVRTPIAIGNGPEVQYLSDWFVIEGVNAFNSGARVVNIAGSNNIIRRVVAWDAAEGNNMIISVNYGVNNLVEDSAAFGIARKVFDSYNANYTTFRRTWGRWEGGHMDGSKMTYAVAYESWHLLAENAIGTANGIKMNENYAVVNWNDPETQIDCNGALPGINCNNYYVYGWVGIFGYDRMKDDKATNSKIIGSIAYMKGDESRVNGINDTDDGGFTIAKIANFTVENSVSYFGGSLINQPFLLSHWSSWSNSTFYDAINLGGSTNEGVVPKTDNGHYYVTKDGGFSGSTEPVWPTNGGFVNDVGVQWWDRGLMNNNAQDLTGIGASAPVFKRWSTSGIESGASAATAFGAGNTLFNNDGTGAEICYRYENGVLTNEPLWPWPMEARIIDAMIYSGRTPVNVTQTIIDMFGPIPSNCRSG